MAVTLGLKSHGGIPASSGAGGGQSSTFNILEVTEPIFNRTADQFARYDDQQISFVDHLNSVLGEEFDIKHIFAFEDDFRTLGMTRVPVDTGDIE